MGTGYPCVAGLPADGPPSAHTTAAVDRCNWRLLDAGLPPELRPELDENLRQRAVAKKLTCAALAAWRAEAGPADISRLHATSAPGATALWNLVPSLTLDNALSQAGGRHARSCMSGGDAVVTHNQVRDIVNDYCRRAGLQPVLAGVLEGASLERRRPADILLPRPGPLLDRLPDAAGASQGRWRSSLPSSMPWDPITLKPPALSSWSRRGL